MKYTLADLALWKCHNVDAPVIVGLAKLSGQDRVHNRPAKFRGRCQG